MCFSRFNKLSFSWRWKTRSTWQWLLCGVSEEPTLHVFYQTGLFTLASGLKPCRLSKDPLQSLTEYFTCLTKELVPHIGSQRSGMKPKDGKERMVSLSVKLIYWHEQWHLHCKVCTNPNQAEIFSFVGHLSLSLLPFAVKKCSGRPPNIQYITCLAA